MDKKPIKFDDTVLPNIIELKDVSQIYGKTTIIKDLNLLIEDKPNQGQFVVILGLSGCVDADTEFFNGVKWKRIADWGNDKVLQFNNDRTANLVNPIDYVVLQEKELNLIQTKYGVDQCFCNDHTIVYKDKRTSKSDNLLFIKGKEFIKRHNDSKVGFNGSFITTFQYNGTGIELSKDEIRLMVAVIADGNFPRKTNYCRVNLKKERKIVRLRFLLHYAEIDYKEKWGENEFITFTFYAPRKEKEFTEIWYSCNNDQLKDIVEECILWDGSTYDNRKYFSTSVKKSADFIQFAASATGTRATISINDRVGEKQGNYLRRSIEYKVIFSRNALVGIMNVHKKTSIKKFKTIDGKKYCFTVPSGMLVLRRNNKIFITGNCGKSTVLRYIAGLQKPTKGEILIHDKPQTKDTCVSMVFQQYSSLPWLSVLDNVALGLKFAGMKKKKRNEKAEEMIELVGLAGHEKKFAKYPILSGGQLQRIAIARSLLANLEIILFDEPFGALDIHTRSNMQQMVADIWSRINNLTVVFVTHDIPEAVFLGDEIWLMSANPGQIVNRIKVPFPLERPKELKRTREFTDLVNDIEDKMIALEK